LSKLKNVEVVYITEVDDMAMVESLDTVIREKPKNLKRSMISAIF